MLEELKDYLLEKLLGYRPVKTKVEKIEDKGVYVWIVKTEEDISIVRDKINRTYKENLGEEPKALHIILSDVNEINKFDKDKLERIME